MDWSSSDPPRWTWRVLEGWIWSRPAPEFICQGEAWPIAVRGWVRTEWGRQRLRCRAGDGLGESRRGETGMGGALWASASASGGMRSPAAIARAEKNGTFPGRPAALFTKPSGSWPPAVDILPTRHRIFPGTLSFRRRMGGTTLSGSAEAAGAFPRSSSVFVPWRTGWAGRRRCLALFPTAGTDGRGAHPDPATAKPQARWPSASQIRSRPGWVYAFGGPATRGVARCGCSLWSMVLAKRLRQPANQLVGL